MAEPVFTVSHLTASIRASMEGQFYGVWVEGEISNLRTPGSGHSYFTLKDSGAQLACVMFQSASRRSQVPLRDGTKVRLYGNVTVYDARGQYQLVVQSAQAQGQGDLQAQFEALKQKLKAEGLFDQERKQSIPKFPKVIGIVTSPTGAAIQDIRNVITRRAPWVRLVVHPVRVQGQGAAEEVASAVRDFNEPDFPLVPDVILVARGGGSIEDLWAFNEEVVARAIAASRIPVLSGVGHEIDFTIADFVADRREPTPSAAAENAVPDSETLLASLRRLHDHMDSLTRASLGSLLREARSLERQLAALHPRRQLENRAQSLDYLSERLERAVESMRSSQRNRLGAAHTALQALHPEKEIQRTRVTLAHFEESLSRALHHRLSVMKTRFHAVGGLMRSLSPDAVLQRGFSMTLDSEGRLVTQADQVKSGSEIETVLSEGSIRSRVN